MLVVFYHRKKRLGGEEVISRVCGVAVNVYMPKDRVTNNTQGFGFVEFKSEADADYVSMVSRSRAFCFFFFLL